MTNIEKHIKNNLGHKAKDKATGMEGVIISVSFDLNGCIQAVLQPGVDKDGKLADGRWFDLKRLEITSAKPVMEIPNYDEGYQADGCQGACDKPCKY